MARKALILAFSERSQVPQPGISGAGIPQTIGREKDGAPRPLLLLQGDRDAAPGTLV